MAELSNFIAGLPKAELHMHLEGALEPSLVRTIAQRNNLPVPASCKERTSGYDFHDLSSFLAIYYPNMAVLLHAEDFAELAYSYLTKAHSQNVIHCELFFDPQAHTSRGVPFRTVIEGYTTGIEKAKAEYGISVGLIMCFLRDMSTESAMTTLEEALPYKHLIVGIGLDSDERNNPPIKFKKVFQRAREEGFRLTMHCDIDQRDSIEHIRQAIEIVEVERIDHGTNILEDGKLVERCRIDKIGFTCCPISNSIVTADFKGKEMLQLVDKGCLVSINSDDPAYFRGYLRENLEKMATDLTLTEMQLANFSRMAFNMAWVSEEQKGCFIRRLDEHVDSNLAVKKGRQAG